VNRSAIERGGWLLLVMVVFLFFDGWDVACCAEFESGEARAAACPRSPSFLPFELRRRMAPRVVALPESQSF
jgi:hypothetical protein